MKFSAAVNTGTNIAVIAFVAAYFWVQVGPNRRDPGHAPRAVALDLSSAQWREALDGASLLGTSDNPPRLLVFTDYQCSFCREAEEELQNYLRHHPDGSSAIRHLPLPIHPLAEAAARAAVCAEEQERFAAMHAALMGASEWQESPDWRSLATIVGLADVDAFDRCLGSSRVDQRLIADRLQASRLGVNATPTFVTPDSMYLGALSLDDVERVSAR